MVRRVLGLQFSSLIIAFIAIISYVTVQMLLTSFNLVDHTHAVMYQVNQIKNDVADCQTSVREYVFTGDDKYIQPYYNKSPGIIKEIDELQWLTRDNQTQQKNVYELRLNTERRLKGFRTVLDTYKSKGSEAGKKLLIDGFGEPSILAMRTVVDTMRNEEQRLLDLRMQDYTLKSNIVLYGIPILMIFYIVIFNISLNAIRHQINGA